MTRRQYCKWLQAKSEHSSMLMNEWVQTGDMRLMVAGMRHDDELMAELHYQPEDARECGVIAAQQLDMVIEYALQNL